MVVVCGMSGALTCRVSRELGVKLGERVQSEATLDVIGRTAGGVRLGDWGAQQGTATRPAATPQAAQERSRRSELCWLLRDPSFTVLCTAGVVPRLRVPSVRPAVPRRGGRRRAPAAPPPASSADRDRAEH